MNHIQLLRMDRTNNAELGMFGLQFSHLILRHNRNLISNLIFIINIHQYIKNNNNQLWKYIKCFICFSQSPKTIFCIEIDENI